MLPSDRAIRAVVLGLECAVNCCKCRNKDIAIAAVSCLRVILFCMVDSRQEYIPFIQWTEINGGLVLQGLIGRYRYILVNHLWNTFILTLIFCDIFIFPGL